jgi:hypothetical protein
MKYAYCPYCKRTVPSACERGACYFSWQEMFEREIERQKTERRRDQLLDELQAESANHGGID